MARSKWAKSFFHDFQNKDLIKYILPLKKFLRSIEWESITSFPFFSLFTSITKNKHGDTPTSCFICNRQKIGFLESFTYGFPVNFSYIAHEKFPSNIRESGFHWTCYISFNSGYCCYWFQSRTEVSRQGKGRGPGKTLNLDSLKLSTTQKMKFSIKDFFRKCDQIRRFLRI